MCQALHEAVAMGRQGARHSAWEHPGDYTRGPVVAASWTDRKGHLERGSAPRARVTRAAVLHQGAEAGSAACEAKGGPS